MYNKPSHSFEFNDKIINENARFKGLINILDEIKDKNEKVLIFVEYLEIQYALAKFYMKNMT